MPEPQITFEETPFWPRTTTPCFLDKEHNTVELSIPGIGDTFKISPYGMVFRKTREGQWIEHPYAQFTRTEYVAFQEICIYLLGNLILAGNFSFQIEFKAEPESPAGKFIYRKLKLD